MASRPSPSQHASEMTVDEVLPGNNSNYWIVKVRANGSHFWRDTKMSTCFKGIKSIRGRHRIFIEEPLTVRAKYMPQYLGLDVSDDFLEVLKKRPNLIDNKSGSESGNAYLFGKMYPSYIWAGTHGNNIAQTGIVLLDGKKIKEVSDEEYKTIMKGPWFDKRVSMRWDQKPLLKYIHSIGHTQILFLGDTLGGDVGADVYVHLNARNEIDSLIIENNCLFPDAELVPNYRSKTKSSPSSLSVSRSRRTESGGQKRKCNTDGLNIKS